MNRLTVREVPAWGRKPVPRPGFSPRTPLNLVPIAIGTATGAVVSAIELGTRSLWLDEGSTFSIVSQHGSALWHGIAHDGGNMLAYYLLMHVLIGWFGHAVWVLRLPSVVANALTGGLVAAVALRLFGSRRIATGAALLTVISLPLVFWGQNARGYAMLVTLSVGSFLALITILRTPAGRRPHPGAVIAYVLTTLAALYVGYDVALLIPAQLALLLLFRERARLVIGCLAVTLCLCVPLLVLAAERGSGQLFWVTPLSWRIAGQAGVTLLSAALPPNFHRTSTTVPAVIVIGLAVIGALVLAVRAALPDASRRAVAWPVLLVLSWVLVPTVLTLIAYAVGEPIELPRVTILVMPALALLLAWALLRPEVGPVLGLAGVGVLLALRLLQVIPSYGVSPEPWNAATAYVLRATPAGQRACVAFYAQDGRESFDYYLRGHAPAGTNPAPNLRPVLPSLPWQTIRPFVERYSVLTPAQQVRVVAECPRLWLLESHAGQSHGTRRSLVNLTRYRRMEEQLSERYPHTSLRSFGWASPIHVRSLWRS